MTGQGIATIVAKLKERAAAHPWVPAGVPQKQHFHRFPSGLTICFTLDILPTARYWHLSIVRLNGSIKQEEINFWRRAFFEEEPTIELPSQIAGVSSMHFHWRVNDGQPITKL